MGGPYVVSKYIDGMSLREKVRERTFTYEESAALSATVAQALHFTHQHGVLHNCVRPSSILFERDTGIPFVTGFSTVRWLSHDSHTILGAPPYFSPELIEGKVQQLDGRSDVFSLGIVLYELLTGKKPFQAKYPELAVQIVSETPVSPRKLDAKIPLELELICLKAMAKRPADRFSTAGKMADALANWQSPTRRSLLSSCLWHLLASIAIVHQ